jgi:outer membrane protein TolC
MSIPMGRSPDRKSCDLCVCVVLALLAGVPFARAQEPPLTIDETEALVIDAEPGRAAIEARSAAAEHRSAAAGSLPDTQFRLGLNNFPVESGGFTTEGMSHVLVGLRQSIPPGQSRKINARRFRTQALALREGAEARGREAVAQARIAWLESYYWQHATALVTETRPFFEDLADVSRSLYALGRKTQQDVLRAELELGRLDDRLIDIARQREQSRVWLAQWVGDEAQRPVASALPSWDDLPGLERLREQLLLHPELKAADARIATFEAGADLARERFKPGWAVDLGYSYRDGYLPDGRPRAPGPGPGRGTERGARRRGIARSVAAGSRCAPRIRIYALAGTGAQARAV